LAPASKPQGREWEEKKNRLCQVTGHRTGKGASGGIGKERGGTQ